MVTQYDDKIKFNKIASFTEEVLLITGEPALKVTRKIIEVDFRKNKHDSTKVSKAA
jgi:hypothetical protein